ncbi:MAG: branched-chain-amino-acid transaminase [Actinobacteria bacterium]|nr:branched-chain-amino-acid transaminase [Actinomycetota bacterium]
MSLKVWMDGELLPAEDAKIGVYDHGLLYGDGVFEGIRAYQGRVFKLDRHLRRLYASAQAISLVIPFTAEQLSRAIYETMEANGQSDAYVRLVVTRGPGDLGLDPGKTKTPVVFIITDRIALYPEQMYTEGMSIITAKTVRTPAQSLNPKVKSLNYLNNILARIEANKAGVSEALMLSCDGYVAECTGDNIFIVKEGKVLTPPVSAGILEGITRDVVIELAAKQGLALEESQLRQEDIYAADECFLTGTAAEIVPVTKIDDKVIGTGKPGPITKRLIDSFHKYVQPHT